MSKFKNIILLFLLILSFTSCIGGTEPDLGTDQDNIMLFSVTYSDNGADSGLVPEDNNDYMSGQVVTVPGNPYNLSKSSFSFTGWNTQPDGNGINLTQGQYFSIGAENVTLYARWTTNTVFSVTYSGNGAFTGTVPLDNTFYEDGYPVAIQGNPGNLQRTGFNFTGWNTIADGSGTVYTQGESMIMGSLDVILYADWTEKVTYNVLYNGNGADDGSAPSDTTGYEEGSPVTVTGNTGNFVKTGYAFSGWSLQTNGSGVTYTQGQTFTMGSADVTLYVKWVTAYSISYMANGAESGDVPVDPAYYAPGSPVTIAGNPGILNKAGYTFSGWNSKSDGTGINYSNPQVITMGSSNMILYARWVIAPVYRVIYNDNEAGSGTVPVDAEYYEEGLPVNVKGNPGLLLKSGYLFKGWNTQPDGGGTTYTEDQTFSMGSSNVTLYALWGGPGKLDFSFNTGSGPDAEVNSIAIQDDGKILITGDFTDYNGTEVNRIIRLNEDGSLDLDFNIGTGTNDSIYTVALQSDGKILIGGVFTSFNGTTRNGIARLNEDGSLDESFDPGTGVNEAIYCITVESGGKILIGGNFTSYDSTSVNYFTRISDDGTIDTGFEITDYPDNNVNCIAIMEDGKIIIGGAFINCGAYGRSRIAVFNDDGTLDESFDPGTGADNQILSVAAQPDDMILLGGMFGSYSGSDNFLARSLSDGSMDGDFSASGSGANDEVYCIAVQDDGKILIGGSFDRYNGLPAGFIVRLNDDGTPDTDFLLTNSADNSVTCIAIQQNGRILVGGGFNIYNGLTRNFIVRIYE
jgi:uncharacterized delta-60 repeat protein/uncharacterized repeat protein (TIGR02543 family)